MQSEQKSQAKARLLEIAVISDYRCGSVIMSERYNYRIQKRNTLHNYEYYIKLLNVYEVRIYNMTIRNTNTSR